MKGELRQTEGSFVSSGGWSGVVVLGKWAGAMGSWQVPTVSAPSTPAGAGGSWSSSSWVGLDGAKGAIPGTTTGDVLQTGISHNVDQATGQPEYYAWFEWVVPAYQAVSTEFPYVYPIKITSATVKPGDEISAILQYVVGKRTNIVNPEPPPVQPFSKDSYHFGGMLLTNVTTGKVLVNVPPTGASFKGESAEWIMECPDAFERGTLPRFSSINFTNAGACDVNEAPPGAYVGVELGKAPQVVFQDAEGNVETNVSAGATSVTINYQNP